MIGYALLAVAMVAAAWISDVLCERVPVIGRILERWADIIAGDHQRAHIRPADPCVRKVER